MPRCVLFKNVLSVRARVWEVHLLEHTDSLIAEVSNPKLLNRHWITVLKPSKLKWQLLAPLAQEKNIELFPVVSHFAVGVYSHAFDMVILTMHSWAQSITHDSGWNLQFFTTLKYSLHVFLPIDRIPMIPFFIKHATCNACVLSIKHLNGAPCYHRIGDGR